MTINITFQEPPIRQGRGLSSEKQQILDALADRPGEWALIKQDVSIGILTQWKKHTTLEVRSSSIGKPKGRIDLYARYIGKALS